MTDLFRQLFGATIKFCVTDYTYTEEQNTYLNIGYNIISVSKGCETLSDINNKLSTLRFSNKGYASTYYLDEDLYKISFKQAKEVIKSLELRFETGYIKGREG